MSQTESFWQGWQRYWAEFNRRAFETTRNPLFAWAEYWDARQDGRPIPDWVLRYLDSCADALVGLLLNSARGDRASLISTALGFKRAGRSGAANPFRSIEGIEDRIRVAWLVEEYCQRYGGKEKEAKRSTVEFLRRHGEKISLRTVDRYWRKYKHLVDLNRFRGID